MVQANDRGAKKRGTTVGPRQALALSFVIPSDFARGREVQDAVMRDVGRVGFTPDNAFAVRLALEEAIINAIKHGNRLDRRKKVRIAARISPRRVEITVEDEGQGFDRGSVPDPTADENVVKSSGRGIMLMESYMTQVRYDRGGRRVTLVKDNV